MSTPQLNRQPTAIFDLIARHADSSDLSALRSTSSTLGADTAAYRKRLQRLEWGLALQDENGVIPSDFTSNERKLRELGVSTFNLTVREEQALRKAFDSLYSPPPPLSMERKEELLRQCAPIYCQLTGRLPVTSWQASVTTDRVAKAYLSYLGVHLYYTMDVKDGDPIRILSSFTNLTHLALLEGSFENTLIAFSEDGERGQTDQQVSTLKMALGRLTKGLDLMVTVNRDWITIPVRKEDGNRDQVLVSLCLRSEADFGSVNLNNVPYENLFERPLVVQQLGYAGFDFLQVNPVVGLPTDSCLLQVALDCLSEYNVAGILVMLSALRNEELLEVLNDNEGRYGENALQGQLIGLGYFLRITGPDYVKEGTDEIDGYGIELRHQLAIPGRANQLQVEYSRGEENVWKVAQYLGQRLSAAELTQLDGDLAATLEVAARVEGTSYQTE